MVVVQVYCGYKGDEGEGGQPTKEILGIMMEMRKNECSQQEKGELQIMSAKENILIGK